MATPLAEQCFNDGFHRQFRKLAAERLIKKALSPRDAMKIVVDPLKRKEFSALGERLFRESTTHADPAQRLLASMYPGYGQLKFVKDLQADHLTNIGNLKQLLGRVPKGSPEHSAVINQIRQAANHFRGQKGRAFEEMGAIAAPRMDMARKGTQIGGGLAAGGLAGLGVGSILGNRNRDGLNQDRLASAPLFDRLRYAVMPEYAGNLLHPKRAHVKEAAAFGRMMGRLTGAGSIAGRMGANALGKGLSAGWNAGKAVTRAGWNAGSNAVQTVGMGVRNPLRSIANRGAIMRDAWGREHAAMQAAKFGPKGRAPTGAVPPLATTAPRQVSKLTAANPGSRFVNGVVGAGVLGIGGLGAAAAVSPDYRKSISDYWGLPSVSMPSLPSAGRVAQVAGTHAGNMVNFGKDVVESAGELPGRTARGAGMAAGAVTNGARQVGNAAGNAMNYMKQLPGAAYSFGQKAINGMSNNNLMNNFASGYQSTQ